MAATSASMTVSRGRPNLSVISLNARANSLFIFHVPCIGYYEEKWGAPTFPSRTVGPSPTRNSLSQARAHDKGSSAVGRQPLSGAGAERSGAQAQSKGSHQPSGFDHHAPATRRQATTGGPSSVIATPK